MNRKQKANQRAGGFWDSDLSNEKHDEIMLWLDRNAEEYGKHQGMTLAHKRWEHPITKGTGNYKTIVGYVDFAALYEREGDFNLEVFFEVKSYIKSCGELIRQIRQYQEYALPEPRFVVVSPDVRFEDILRDQGIDFWAYPEY